MTASKKAEQFPQWRQWADSVEKVVNEYSPPDFAQYLCVQSGVSELIMRTEPSSGLKISKQADELTFSTESARSGRQSFRKI